MPFRFSGNASQGLPLDARSILDVRNAPVRGRTTQFRLAQQNMLAYTFDAGVPGWAAPGLNSMPFREVALQPVQNAHDEGRLLFGTDYSVDPNASAKVTGDIYETITSAVLWETAAAWNTYMRTGAWVTTPRYPRPRVTPSEHRQIAVLNLPRRYDWVRLLTPRAKAQIATIRSSLAANGLGMPTSTPDVAIVVLPPSEENDPIWTQSLGDISLTSQTMIDRAHTIVEGKVEPGEIVLAIALKTSLRSDRLYQPLYEANVMQFLLEGQLGAPKVEFEVHTLDSSGTAATQIYTAASLHSAAGNAPHRAIRELYTPTNAVDLVQRFLAFLNDRMNLVAP